MTVYIPTPLRSYTSKQGRVFADGDTLEAVLLDLDRQFPGIRFRIINEQNGIREHIKFFVNQELCKSIFVQTRPSDTVHIICALSGG